MQYQFDSEQNLFSVSYMSNTETITTTNEALANSEAYLAELKNGAAVRPAPHSFWPTGNSVEQEIEMVEASISVYKKILKAN